MIKKIFNLTIFCILILITVTFDVAYARQDEGGGFASDWKSKTESSSSSSSSSSSDNPFSGAKNFLDTGQGQVDNALNETELKNTSDSIYNIVLGIAIIAAVAIGIVIGIKFMLASSSEKADIKELLIPYVLGVIVVFGAIGIWKLAINVFSDF